VTRGQSIYQRALGADFGRLHPQVQRRFGLTANGGVASIGTGVMTDLWHGAAYTLPFLYVGTWRSIMFPEKGSNVPFTIGELRLSRPSRSGDCQLGQNI
jgi:hypothetical protein